jgi:hypothetical protein
MNHHFVEVQITATYTKNKCSQCGVCNSTKEACSPRSRAARFSNVPLAVVLYNLMPFLTDKQILLILKSDARLYQLRAKVKLQEVYTYPFPHDLNISRIRVRDHSATDCVNVFHLIQSTEREIDFLDLDLFQCPYTQVRLPDTVRALRLDYFAQDMPYLSKHPNQLTTLFFYRYSLKQNLEEWFQNSPHLQELRFFQYFLGPLPALEVMTQCPLQTLILGESFKTSLDELPPTVTYLDVGNRYNRSLSVLFLSGNCNNLQKLILGNRFNQPLFETEHIRDQLLNLTELHLGDDFNQRGIFFPRSIVSISFGKTFNQKLYFGSSGSSDAKGQEEQCRADDLGECLGLQHLRLGDKYNHCIDICPGYCTQLKFIQVGKVQLSPGCLTNYKSINNTSALAQLRRSDCVIS